MNNHNINSMGAEETQETKTQSKHERGNNEIITNSDNIAITF